MKKNKSSIGYQLSEELLEIIGGPPKDLIKRFMQEASPKKSCWFSSLPTNISMAILGRFVPSITKFMTELGLLKISTGGEVDIHTSAHTTLSTAKLCPGIRSILNTSTLLLSPCDIHIVVSKGMWVCTVAEPALIAVVEDHPAAQLAPLDLQANIFKDKTVLKIKLPLFISLPKNTPAIFLQPQFHNDIGMDVVHGVLENKYARISPLNIVYLVDTSEELEYSITIRKGQVLAYLWTPKMMSLSYEGPVDLGSEVLRTSFTRGYEVNN